MTEEILSAVSSEVFSVWFLIGAALVCNGGGWFYQSQEYR